MSQAPHVVRGARWGLRLGPAQPLEDTLWEALRDSYCGTRDGGDRGEARRVVRHRSRGGGRLRRSGARRAPRPRGRRARSPTRSCRSRSRTGRRGRTVAWAARRAHAARTRPPRASPSCRRYFKKDGVVTAGNASGICRRRGRAGGGRRGAWRASAGCDRSAGWSAWGVAGVEPEHHGHRSGARPRARRSRSAGLDARGHGPGRGERGVRGAVPGGGEGARARPRAHQRGRRRHRARASARRQRRPHHRSTCSTRCAAAAGGTASAAACIGGGPGHRRHRRSPPPEGAHHGTAAAAAARWPSPTRSGACGSCASTSAACRSSWASTGAPRGRA